MDNTSTSQTMSSGNKKQRLKGRPKSKHNKPKMTKEQRREKYTNIARNRREANMTRARDKQLICFKCRKTGHSAANCKIVSTSDGNSSNNNMPIQRKKNICYKCGSTEHRIQACPLIQKYIKAGRDKKGIDYANVGELPFAMYYVCNKTGHLSSYFPEGKKVCYPTGGGCRECGSVDHYVADCPERKKGKKQTNEDTEKDVTIDQYLDDEPVVEQ
eukprot:195917_1